MYIFYRLKMHDNLKEVCKRKQYIAGCTQTSAPNAHIIKPCSNYACFGGMGYGHSINTVAHENVFN